jgi:DNA-binding NtrC family response regulator
MENRCLEKKHILIVDDEETLLMTYRLILEMQGYRTSSAISAIEAKGILSSDHFDLLICDLSLGPGESGTDVVKYARTAWPNLPCMLATGYNEQELQVWSTQHNVMLLQKPISIHRLLQSVVQLLQESQRRKTA